MKKIVIVFLLLTACQLSCKTTNAPCIGTPKEDCMCTQQYDPVCGCDNKTYGNACMASCAGVKTWTKGECK